MGNKISVAIIFGGQSGEHEVSLMSATSVIKAIDKEKYHVIPIGITKDGQWLLYHGPVDKIESGEWEAIAKNELMKDPINNKFSVIPMGGPMKIDVVFPVLHGPYGEDGTIQGLLEMANIPYVGAGVLASSIGMDKIYSKKIFKDAGLPMGKYRVIMRKKMRADMDGCISDIEENFDYPVFIKPANLGSSVGITKAHNREELKEGLEEGAKYDRKILVEAFIHCREIECAVRGNDDPVASVVGEILPSHEFYDYKAKYFDDGKSKMVIPAPLPEDKASEIRRMAVAAYKAIDCTGLARVDFFLDKDTMELYINELNTMPGFTKYSMYPLLWASTGLPYDQLIDTLIQLAMDRYKER